MPELSVIVPARNEEFLGLTLDDVCKNIRGNTEVIVVLDGAWPEPGLTQRENVHVVYLPEPIGQRAATNLGARLSTADYILKLDAHCAVAEGFDVELIRTAKELGDDVTQIPAQHNLHIYDRVCEKCGKREYQGSLKVPCVMCGEINWRREILWKPIRRRTEFWRFDPAPHFQYWGAFKERPEAQGEIVDVMTSLGACFFMSRQRFWELDGLDESYGGWGSFGIEVALKSWLSGGRHVVNRRTWFSHFFRVGGIGFPYPMSGNQQEHARQQAKQIWFNNAWPKQTRPLSWLIKKFAPVPAWHDGDGAAALELVMLAGAAFASRQQSRDGLNGDALKVASVVADATEALSTTSLHGIADGRELMPIGAVSAPSLLCAEAVPSQDVMPRADLSEMCGIDAQAVITPVIDEQFVSGDVLKKRSIDPCRDDSVDSPLWTATSAIGEPETWVPSLRTDIAGPIPAASVLIDENLAEDSSELIPIEMRDSEILAVSHASASCAVVGLGAGREPTRFAPPIVSNPGDLAVCHQSGIVYYTDSRIDPDISRIVQERICLSARGFPVAAVTCADQLIPSGFGFWRDVAVTYVRLKEERGYLTMFRQILAGLEALDTEFVFFCEHDVLYHPSHFDFTPPNHSQVFYNQNVWKVDAESGRALHYLCSQTSGLCASRDLLLEHYRKRVAMVEANGFSRKMGFEPGTHRRTERVDDLTSRTWMSEWPNVDIRHDNNLTPSRWAKSQFRDQRYTKGWTESDTIPGWGVTKGRFREFLQEVAIGAVQQAVA